MARQSCQHFDRQLTELHRPSTAQAARNASAAFKLALASAIRTCCTVVSGIWPSWPLNSMWPTCARHDSLRGYWNGRRWSRPISRVLSWAAIHLGRRSPVASCNLPAGSAGRFNACLFGLAPGGVYLAVRVATNAVVSYTARLVAGPSALSDGRAVSPLPVLTPRREFPSGVTPFREDFAAFQRQSPGHRRSALCCTVRRLGPCGL